MCNEQAVYFGRLESHHVALVGEEAQEFDDKTEFYNIGSKPDKTKVKECALVEALRAKHKQNYYLSSENGVNEIPSIAWDSENKKPIALLFYQNCKEKKEWELPCWNKLPSKDNEIIYKMDLSGLSSDEAFLIDKDKNTETCIALKLGKATIELFNAPYLLSPARLSKLQRHQLFAHLSVSLLLTVKLNTGTVVLEIWGDNGEKINYSFAGSYPSYERIMFSHWYEDIMLDICINEPPEVKGHHA